MEIKLSSADFFVERGRHIFTFDLSSELLDPVSLRIRVPNGGKGISEQWFSAHDHLVIALQHALERATQLRDLTRPVQEQAGNPQTGE